MISSKRTVLWLGGVLALLVLVATLTSVLNPGSPNTTIQALDARGNAYEALGSGLYKFDPAGMVAEAIAWDAVNLVLGVPMLLLALILYSQGRRRGAILLAGLLFYFFYVFIMYVTMVALNWLFLVYVAIFALSWVTLALLLSQFDVAAMASAVKARFPRRALAIYVFAFSALLLALWSGRVLPAITTEQLPAGFEGLSTLETQALDLGLLVPMMLLTGILLWKRHPWGYTLGGIAVTVALMMFVALPVMVLGAASGGGTVRWGEVAVMGIFIAIGLILPVLYFRNVVD